MKTLGPHPGAQRAFLASSAYFAIYGGTAGSGKSAVSLIEGARHIHRPAFRAVYFRKTSADLRKPKGLWDNSHAIYPHAGGAARDALLEWRFPSGAWIKMNHLERDSDMFDHQGAEYPLIVWDELTQHSSASFWYLSSRNRAPIEAGIRPYQRGNCNPDPDSFVMTEFLDPGGYIDDEGFPRPEMSGRLRYYVRDPDGEGLIWGDSVDELVEKHPKLFSRFPNIAPRELAKSFTFVPAKLSDNPSMGPDYEATLAGLPYVERMRLLYGNWRIRESAGNVFRGEWYPIVDDVPPGRWVRYWDLAGSKRRRSDFTAGLMLVAHDDGTYTVLDVKNEQRRPLGVEQLLHETAVDDTPACEVHIEQETGAAGELLIDQYARGPLRGFSVTGHTVRNQGTKLERAKPASSASEKGHVRLKRAPWNRDFLGQLQAFPDGRNDDMVDAFTGAFAAVQEGEFAFASGSMGGRR